MSLRLDHCCGIGPSWHESAFCQLHLPQQWSNLRLIGPIYEFLRYKFSTAFLEVFLKMCQYLTKCFFTAGLTTLVRGGVTWKTLMTCSGSTRTRDTAAGTSGTPSRPPSWSQPLARMPGHHTQFNNKVFGYHSCGTPDLSDYRYW